MKHLFSIVLLMSAGNFSWKTFQRRRFFRADAGIFSNAINAINVNIGNMRRSVAVERRQDPPPKCLIEDLLKKLKTRQAESKMANEDLKAPSVRITHPGKNETVKVKR